MIYFASDIHLGGGDETFARANERRFVAWLDRAAQDAEAIVLAGDIFDFWFEVGEQIPPGFDLPLNKLKELTARGIEVIFFTGNHDMWLNGYFQRACGMQVFDKPELLTLKGRRVYVAHGDNISIRHRPVLRLLNACFRSRKLRKVFEKVVPYDRIIRFGRWWSGHSRKSHAGTDFDASVTEPLIAHAREYARTHEVDDFVFGHMHFPRDYREGALHTIHLGGWEKHPSYAVLDDAGTLTLKTIDL